MSCRLTILLLCFFSLLAGTGKAQYQLPENRVWIFPLSAGIDFNTPTPTPFILSRNPPLVMTAVRTGAASVADTSGQLCFSSNGSFAWDRQGQVMNNNQTMHPLLSTNYSPVNRMGTLIVPAPGQEHLYYLFTLAGNNVGVKREAMGKLFYTLIDMRLNNGLGDVVAGSTGMVLDSMLTNKMVAVAGTCNNVWLIVIDRSGSTTHQFKAYEITNTGIRTTPVRSLIIHNPLDFTSLPNGVEYQNGGKAFRASPDGSKLVACDAEIPRYGTRLELFDFDPTTGQVSNQTEIDNERFGYHGAAFSPDGSKLYAMFGTNDSAEIMQFDITSGHTTAIKASKLSLGECSKTGIPDIRLAPDGRIYFSSARNNQMAGTDPHTLGMIRYPDIAGPGCGFTDSALSIPPAPGIANFPNNEVIIRNNMHHFPTEVAKAVRPDTISQVTDTGFCDEGIYLTAPAGYHNYTWNDGSGDSIRYVTGAGVYYVYSTRNCDFRTDSFFVHHTPLEVTLGNDTVICNGREHILEVPQTTGASISWSTGSSDMLIRISESGSYSVVLRNMYCTKSDTVTVSFVHMQPDIGQDTTLCSGTPFHIRLEADHGDAAELKWQNGITNSSILVSDSGTYHVTATHPECSPVSDTMRINLEICTCKWLLPDAFTPNNDGRNDHFRLVTEPGCPVADFFIRIINRWGQVMYESQNSNTGWDGSFKDRPAETGTYMYECMIELGTDKQRHFLKGDVQLIR